VNRTTPPTLRSLLPALAFLAAAPAPAQDSGTVTRGPLTVHVKTNGTVRAEDVFRIRSTIEGRIERVRAKELRWAGPRDELGRMLTLELAAMMDARATTPSQTLEERWKRVYRPTKLFCPKRCFVTKVFAREGKVVKPNALLIEAAGKLRLVGRVRPGDAQWIREGQLVKYWPKSDPKKRIQGRVEKFVLDVQGETVEPGGTFTILLDPGHYLDPGTEWEGEITIVAKKNVLRVPTEALLHHKGEVFLPVRVSTGVTSYGTTEITAGIKERQHFLLLAPGEDSGVPRHSPAGPPPEQFYDREEPAPAPSPRRRAKKKEKRKQEKRRPSRRRRDPERRARPRRREEAEPVKIRRIKRQPGEIDVFPEEQEVDEDDRFPSDYE
jgi:hypothetical protein